MSDVQWHLAGPGVNLVTNMSYGEEPSESWVETFLPSSTYTYRDDNRPGAVYTFQTTSTALVGTQGSGQAPLTSTTPQASSKTGKANSTDVVGSGVATVRGTLLGTVSAAGKLSLTSGGKTVSTLKAGLLHVHDHRSVEEGRLQRPGDQEVRDDGDHGPVHGQEVGRRSA